VLWTAVSESTADKVRNTAAVGSTFVVIS